jgi:hypothetical protein
MSFMDFAKPIASLVQEGFGLMQMSEGTDYQAQSLRSAGASAMAIANYNAQLQDVKLGQTLDQGSRALIRLMGTQRAQEAGSGFAMSSKSYLAIGNATLTNFEREVVTARNNEAITKQNILYEGRLQQTAAENQARAAEYQGGLSMAKGIGSMISQGFSLLGGM